MGYDLDDASYSRGSDCFDILLSVMDRRILCKSGRHGKGCSFYCYRYTTRPPPWNYSVCLTLDIIRNRSLHLELRYINISKIADIDLEAKGPTLS